MATVDFILNLAGLLLWLNWRSNRFDPLVRRVPATLMGTLRPADPKKLRRWHLLVFIALLLFVRAVIYWWIGREANWSAKLNLGMTVLWFSCGSHWVGLLRMITYSFLSFGLVLGVFYIFLLPLSLLAGPLPTHGLVTIPLGSVDGWPRWARAILPFFATAICWWLVSWLLNRLDVLTPVTMAGRFQQSLLFGASSYLLWKFPLGAILLLYLVNSYIYFGKHPFWKYISVTAQTLLWPLRVIPSRIGRVNFAPILLVMAPLLALAILFLAAELARRGLNALYARLLG